MSSNVPSPRLRYSRFGKPRRLANVKIVEAVAVDIADRNAVVPVNVDPARAVEHGSPIIDAMEQLLGIGFIAGKSAGRNIRETGRGRPGASLR